MTFLPGWTSVGAVGGIAHWLHISAIVVLALLVVAEGMALIYDSRKDTLIAAAERAAGEQRQEDQQQADERHRAEMARVQQQLDETRKQQAPRRLSDQQKNTILAAILPYPGQKVDLVTIIGDEEAAQYAYDFDEIFKQAKWIVFGGGVAKAVYTGGAVIDITVSISKAHGDRSTAPKGAANLIMAMIKLGIIKEGFSDPAVIGDTVQVRIGRKPSGP